MGSKITKNEKITGTANLLTYLSMLKNTGNVEYFSLHITPTHTNIHVNYIYGRQNYYFAYRYDRKTNKLLSNAEVARISEIINNKIEISDYIDENYLIYKWVELEYEFDYCVVDVNEIHKVMKRNIIFNNLGLGL